jgi:hypothetical protein
MGISNIAQVVVNMMLRFGAPVTVVVSEGTYDPTESENTTTDTTYTPNGMVLDYTLQSNGSQTLPNTLIEAGDKQIFLEPLDGMPALRPGKDHVVLGSDKYKIVTVKELNPSQAANTLIELLVRM